MAESLVYGYYLEQEALDNGTAAMRLLNSDREALSERIIRDGLAHAAGKEMASEYVLNVSGIRFSEAITIDGIIYIYHIFSEQP